MPTPSDRVRVRGAREHNLRDVDVEVPRDAIVAFTGVSGSGKSSLAFGTIFAEAQRRYLESVAPYARRLIDQAPTPDVDAIDGLPPAVALRQQRSAGNARSSVASVTTLSSLIRLLYSRAGSYPPDQPMLYAEDFSPNTVQGACPTCHGIGRVYDVTERALVPDDSLTIREHAIAGWPPAWHGQNLRDILVSLGYDVDIPWRDLPREDRDWILFTEDTPTVPVYAGATPEQTRRAREDGVEPSYQGTFSGARRYILHTFAHSKSERMKKRVAPFLSAATCPTCDGRRLTPAALSVTVEGFDIAALAHLTLDELVAVLERVARADWQPRDEHAGVSGPDEHTRRDATRDRVERGGSAHAGAPDVRRTVNFSDEKRVAARRLATDALERLRPILGLGLGYLSLDRPTPTLSAGEMQRLRLATQLSSDLFGVVFVLDEPSAGLHPRDGEALGEVLRNLRDAGNSVFVVEHDLDVVREAEWIVDIGPGAGGDGGRVLYSGPLDGLADVDDSVTRGYLFGSVPVERHTPRVPDRWLRLAGVTRNNLRDLDASFPVGCLTVVTGVSGSGKSSLVSQALPDLVAEYVGAARTDTDTDDDADPLLAGGAPEAGGRLVGDPGPIARVVSVDQKPIGRTPRSNVATYTGLFDHVRKKFAATDEARRRGYGVGRFSFNVPEGRCPTCEGEGWMSVELLFLPSVYAPCPTCHGTRYQAQTLEIEWNGLTIADVLALDVDTACTVFADEDDVLHPLTVLREVGLGYLRLGQPATELSGGEAQRVKLASELRRGRRGDTVYVLDEPTTGLHPADADRLMRHLRGLVDGGNTVVVVEHDMRIVAQADHVIELGPGAGADGGRIVATGTPEDIVRVGEGATAPYLSPVWNGESG